jgi:putative hemolysin
MVVFAITVASALVFTFLCSISEAVLLSLRHAQIEALGESGTSRILRRFKEQIDAPISAILVVNTAANVLGGAIGGASYVEAFGASTLWVFSLAFTGVVLLVGEIVPKTLGVIFARRLMTPVAYYVKMLTTALLPLLVLTGAFSRMLRRRGEKAPVTSLEEIRLLASLGRTHGAVTARAADIIEGAVALRELTAYDVMVPRNSVAYLSGDRTLEENLAIIRRTGHSRFPFTPDGDLDRVEGVVLAKGLLFQLREHDAPPNWKSLLGEMLVTPAQQPLERLLRTFQEQRRHLAFVVDEYGGIQGIVTLEDVLEEIVGEIEDESDRVDPRIIRRPDGSLVCRGLAETRKVFELLGVDEEVEMVTVGGFVAELVGRLPRTGDSVTWNGYRFDVLRASARRVEHVQITSEVRSVPSPASRHP